MSKHRCNAAAVVVTYEPDEKSLRKLVNILYSQVTEIYIIDNASSVSVGLSKLNVTLTVLQKNMGIAHAQNIGIGQALADGFTDFVLFDQDSLPSETMISDLLQARRQACDDGLQVAAVGPVHIDQDSFTNSIFISTQQGNIDKIEVPEPQFSEVTYASCDFLIASGCLISKAALDRVGYMEDGLFIDCVDIEWGFRANSRGLHCIAAFEAKMYHKIGEAPLKLLGRNLTTHSPLRHYYFYRNFYRLLKRPYVPSCWKKHTLLKSLVQAIVFTLFLKPRFQHFKYIVKGVFHGLVERSGKYE
ncbi:glycosyltransferase family 2 protein [Vibrio lentus]|uniref:Rhamnosyltransferase n=1 Tax=Vibrio lentus TaxID=136468 RepID=A0AA44VX22_9VIBR|nr:glycosyltransferase family 2 protein [Vibrio lentus]MCB5361873.1 glycosyltransferase family 2 protein [Vibrio lentus]MCB5447637.1 glycosyltransferase family 2 protein [Vibrio lentus]MCB5464263.1 glycosyltransferase family 2 protein [Vibrio lentus]MCC4796280.1 glycosyltransferase family 2 protein [Vibrio lentus]MCC4853539.1 glycosyltransferase family 2 protein [Vibrio lentus]